MAKNERLSLRDMVLRWCDPVLVDAVRAAEAPFTEDQVIAACPCSLGGAAPAVPDPPDLDFDAIARIQAGFGPPWNNLVADLRSRIMISRIALTGIDASDPEAMPVSIPPSLANQYGFDFGASTVVWSRGKWFSVTAVLTTEAAAIDDGVEAPLPLEQAMLTWCNDVLVDRYETAAIADHLAQDIRQGRWRPGQERRNAGISTFDLHLVDPWAGRLQSAKAAVQTDFSARIASGDVELSGLQTEPAFAAERAPLSAAWAKRMQFDWKRQAVRIESALFVDVLGITKAAVRVAQAQCAGQSRRRGRPSYPLEQLAAIARDRGAKRAPTKEREADILLEEFRRWYPAARPPKARTIQDHVEEIYATAAGNAGPLKPLK